MHLVRQDVRNARGISRFRSEYDGIEELGLEHLESVCEKFSLVDVLLVPRQDGRIDPLALTFRMKDDRIRKDLAVVQEQVLYALRLKIRQAFRLRCENYLRSYIVRFSLLLKRICAVRFSDPDKGIFGTDGSGLYDYLVAYHEA